MMDPLALVLIFAGAALLCGSGLARLQAERGLRDRLGTVVRQAGLTSLDQSVASKAPAWPYTAAIAIGRRLLGGTRARDALTGNLKRAGIQFAGAAELFAASRLLIALATGAAAVLVFGKGGALVPAVIGALAGAFAATYLVKTLAGRREQAIRKELPVMLDLLSLALEGGAGIEQAIRFLAQPGRLPSKVVIKPLQMLVADLDRGVPHDLALERLGERLATEPALLFVQVLRQSLRHGTEVVPALKVLAEDLAERRLQDAKAAIGRIATSMTVIMVVCFLPALLMLIAAPAIGDIGTTLRAFAGQ
ncbi:MAG TPA: type II secretion system F family protein [Roseomonas sp.]|jgi:tight adherence protein C